MIAVILALLQTGHDEPAAQGAEHASGGGGGHETAWIVEQTNHLLGPTVVKIQDAIMPPIYGLFGAHWQSSPPDHAIPQHVFFTIVAFLICIVGALILRGRLSVDKPSKGQQLLEVAVEQVRGLLDQVVGPYGRRYTPVIGAFALFILVGNLIGLVPGLGAATDNINATGALGLASFLYYIGMGFKQQGLKYLKHFTGGLTGPMLYAIGWLIFIVELISNSVRPVTLSLRLFVNMFADHKIAAAFLDLAPWLVPIFTIVLGVFVSFIQTFIFIMLSMVYLSETVPHEEHDHEEHGHGAEATAEAH